MVPKSERFEMRLDEETISRIDEWRSEQAKLPSRAEAMRRLVEAGLSRIKADAVSLSDGEKLIIMMLRDLYKHFKVSEPDIDPNFVAKVIWGGHLWAPKWELPGLFHDHEDNPADLHFVLDVLEMWDFLERGYELLSKKNKERIAKDAAPFGKHVSFTGFDGNNEGELIGIAKFLVNEMDRFSRFKGREMNAHMPTKDMHRRTLVAFKPMLRRLSGGELGVSEIVTILKAMRYPE